jgi:pimeloyl-ACP methyl ester carboxylesterase
MPVLDELQHRLQAHLLSQADTTMGVVQYRHAGATLPNTTHVLLHGIGSGSGSWLMQLQAASLSKVSGLLAWEAPGYGESTPVEPAKPLARDYAERVWAWLDAVGVTHPITLVGHSLGALMGASAALAQPARVSRLVLLAPAQGHGMADEALRVQKRDARLSALNTLGPQGMARQRGSAMLSPKAAAEQLAFVQLIMAQVKPAGYTQATFMLAQADLATDLQHAGVPLTIASGRADVITPVDSCQQLAQRLGVPWHDLGDVGHACPLEAALAVNDLLGLPASPSP